MQGRLAPANSKIINKFPINWKKEFIITKNLELDFIELIFNNEKNDPLLNEIFLRELSKNYKNKIYSINLNYFAKNSYFKNIKIGNLAIKRAIKISKILNLKKIVLPCIEKNNMSETRFLKFVNIIKKLNNSKIQISFEVGDKILKKKNVTVLNKNYGICFDVGNLSTENPKIYKRINKYKSIINHIHIKDKKYSLKKKNYLNCLLGEGVVDFKNFFAELKKINRTKHYFTLETFHGTKPIINAKKNINFLKRLIITN